MGVDPEIGAVERNPVEHCRQRLGAGRQAVAEGIRRAFEDQRQSAGPLGDILADLAAGPLRVRIIDALHQKGSRARLGADRRARIGDARRERVDADVVVGAGQKALAAGQGSLSERAPAGLVERRKHCISKNSASVHHRPLHPRASGLPERRHPHPSSACLALGPSRLPKLSGSCNPQEITFSQASPIK